MQFPAVVQEGETAPAVVSPATLAHMNRDGIRNLVTKMESDLMASRPIQKGERIYTFFATPTYHRKRNERIMDYVIRWQEAQQRFKEV